MENKQNRNSQSQASSSQSTHNNMQSNQPSMSSSSSSNQSRSQSSGMGSSSGTSSSSMNSSRNTSSNAGNSSSSNSGSSKSSLTDKLGGLDMNSVTSKLQEYGSTAMNKVNSLSTTQKVVGGSLLALGAGWLAMSSKNKGKIKNKLNTTRSNKFGRTS